MKTRSHSRSTISRRQRGVALLIALFALLLLSCIGLGMMYSADTETSINANYKDKEAAIYAANGGLEEAKDRLLSQTGDITPPTGTPSLTAQNIIYLINPGASESFSDITPWTHDTTYADTELCQENVLGLTQNLGTPCTGSSSLPSSSNWYRTIDNTGHWSTQLGSTPLNYKWVRIQLKNNNSTPFPVDGSNSNSGQVCWDGLHQIQLPTGYNSACNPQGAITLTLTNGGTGYSSAPTVTVSAPPSGGTQATFTPVMTSVAGAVTSITVGSPGSGYSTATPPTVTIDPPASGTQATATANVIAAGGYVTGASLSNTPTGCYSSAIGTVSAENGGGSGAKAAVVMTTTKCVLSVTFTSSGSGCSSGTFTLSGGTSNASVTASLSGGKVKTNPSGTYTASNPGAGFSATPTLSSNCSTQPNYTVALGYQVASVNMSGTGATGGAGYTSAPDFNTFPGPTVGTTPLVNAAQVTVNASNPNAGQISGFTITNSGSGYLTVPNVTVAPPASGTTATGTAVTSITQKVTGFTPASSGSGYTGSPTVTITAPGGSGTTATASAAVGSGPFYSPVILLTALGQTKQGGRAMTQMEVAYNIRSLTLPGALTLAGPQPSYGSPNSNNFYISGVDHPNGYDGTGSMNPPGCNGTASSSHPAIGVYDDPNNPTSPSSVDTLLAPGVLQPDGTHYPGVGTAPDVQNVYGALGLNTPSDFDQLVTYVASEPGAIVIPSGTFQNGTASSPVVEVNYGNLTLSGNNTGYGILVVTGVLTFNGNFTWNGIVMVIGQGDIEFGGGGGGTINGSVIIAKTKDSSGNELSTLGTPTLNWSGGGGNGIYYDHCWSDGLLNSLPLNFPATNNPLQVLSIRTMPY